MNTTTKLSVLALAAFAAACAPKRVNQEPILENDDRVPEASTQGVAVQAANQQATQQMTRDSLAAEAIASCYGDICAAVTRGEVALGMNETQVLAATRTTYDAWTVRRADGSAILVPRSTMHAPHDAMGELAMVQVAVANRLTSTTWPSPGTGSGTST